MKLSRGSASPMAQGSKIADGGVMKDHTRLLPPREELEGSVWLVAEMLSDPRGGGVTLPSPSDKHPQVKYKP